MLFSSIIGVLQFMALPSNQMEPKVAHGNKANIRDHPHSVFIVVSITKYNAHVCGASVINQKILLTAAHCFEDISLETRATAHVGHTDRRKGHVISITAVKTHSQYNSRKIVNDIALAGLDQELHFSDIVRRVALAERRPQNVVASLAGWGLISEDPVKSTYVLHSTDQKVWAYKDCMKFLKKIPDGTFCCGKHVEGGYASVGDSGSPLVVNNYLQIGLVSFKKVHISASIVLYTDVAYFYDWIIENVGTVFCG